MQPWTGEGARLAGCMEDGLRTFTYRRFWVGDREREWVGGGLTGSEDGFGGAREREGLMERPGVSSAGKTAIQNRPVGYYPPQEL